MAKLKKAPESKQNTLAALSDVACGKSIRSKATQEKPDSLFIVSAGDRPSGGGAGRNSVQPHIFAAADEAELERFGRLRLQAQSPKATDGTVLASRLSEMVSDIANEE